MNLNDTYQILVTIPDLFDYEIESWKNASLDLLHVLHNEYLGCGEFTSTDFNQFIEYGIQKGFIRATQYELTYEIPTANGNTVVHSYVGTLSKVKEALRIAHTNKYKVISVTRKED